MSMFKKKPVVIEARQTGQDYDEDTNILGWSGGQLPHPDEEVDYLFVIPTMEGEMQVKPGDWVIKGVQGEFYPCKPDIFEATYEEVVA
jgi:hypothetical protein